MMIESVESVAYSSTLLTCLWFSGQLSKHKTTFEMLKFVTGENELSHCLQSESITKVQDVSG